METGDLRLRVHLVLEDAGGNRIAEIQQTPVIPGILDPAEWRESEPAFRQMLETFVVGPARCLVAAQVERQSGSSFHRLDRTPKDHRLSFTAGEQAGLESLLAETAEPRP